MATKQYKTNRKYECPYCSDKFLRNDLIDHIESKHQEMIPEGYSAGRVIYEAVNKKNHGTCMICKDPVYEWDEKLCRYKNLCNKKACRESVRQTSINNMMRVYNKPHLLNDPDQQEKMLAKRKISGNYKFSTDGSLVTYTGQYEKKLLEFLDKVMNIEGKDIQCPGPVFEYDFGGKKHFWITDIYYIPANLVIEVKDGGDNPNNRPMKEYRDKQIAKEEMITNKGTFNYLRLTNNNFLQLFEILANIKYDMIEPDRGIKININEAANENKEENEYNEDNSWYYLVTKGSDITIGILSPSTIYENTPVGTGPMGGVPPQNADAVYVIPKQLNNTFADNEDDDIDIIITGKDFKDKALVEHRGVLKSVPIDDTLFLDSFIYEYVGDRNKNNFVNTILEAYNNKEKVNKNFILECMFGRPVLDPEEIFYSSDFKDVTPIDTEDFIKSTLYHNFDCNCRRPIETENLDNGYFISNNPEGYFIHEKIPEEGKDIYVCSIYYKDKPKIEDINTYIIPKLDIVKKKLSLGGDF